MSSHSHSSVFAGAGSESALGLNDHHQATALNYMRFARYQRGQRLRAVNGCFEDLKDSRLIEDTFTIDEVTEMLDGLLSVVQGEVETELINTAHTNVLLLRQLFQQAEKWHLKLQADISELENRDLLEKIKDFEDSEFSGARRDSEKPTFKLEPLNESGGSALLNMEIQRLQEENEKLKGRLQNVESQAISAQRQKGDLQAALDKANKSQSSLPAASSSNSQEVEQLRRQISQLKAGIDQDDDDDENSASSGQRSQKMEGELTGTKHELLRVQEMLEMAEKELEKKVSQTAPFRNLKQMLQKKNEQIKDLRKRLGKYEQTDD